MNSISVVVPLHDPHETQFDRVKRMVYSIALQGFLPRQLVISSNHDVTYIDELLSIIPKTIQVDVVRNSSKHAPQNVNFAVNCASEPLVKVLFQDDFLLGGDYLAKISHYLSHGSASWLVTRSLDLRESNMSFIQDVTPRYTERLRNGINTIGSPSCVAFRRETYVPFDQDMVYMFDCEWYLRMAHTFGRPTLTKDSAVVIGIHGDQATHWAKKLLSEEKQRTKNLHRVSRPEKNSRRCSCQQ